MSRTLIVQLVSSGQARPGPMAVARGRRLGPPIYKQNRNPQIKASIIYKNAQGFLNLLLRTSGGVLGIRVLGASSSLSAHTALF